MTAQSARADARGAVAGDAAAFDRLASSRADIAKQRAAQSAAQGAERAFATASSWSALDAALAALGGARETLLDVHAALGRLLELAPQLLVATGNLASVLPPADLAADRPALDRFELSVLTVRQSARALAAGSDVDESVQRLNDAGQYVGQIIRGLRGEDTTLGMTPLRGQTRRRTSSPRPDCSKRRVSRSAPSLRAPASSPRPRPRRLPSTKKPAACWPSTGASASAARGPPRISGSTPLILLAIAVLLVLLTIMIHYQARASRRAAENQSEQNERNQQAILRLLDELSSLADGDLTVQATVTEDITGAIADSINYAIEALRELVATDQGFLDPVDAASKQTEGTARQLLRAGEAQAKQAAAASESMARMAMSIEEVSGNAERCSDVARHSVEVAHKGGEAVRRTIDGMNTIRETIQDTSKRIKRLGESSQEIGNIVELIEEIAEQTNILALNASIEASMAGRGGPRLRRRRGRSAEARRARDATRRRRSRCWCARSSPTPMRPSCRWSAARRTS